MQNRRTETRTCAPAGLTLIEVLMAVAVLSIALMGTLNMWVNAERLSMIAREEAIAQAAINRVISEMRATDFIDIPGQFSGGKYFGAASLNERLLPRLIPVNIGGDTELKGIVSSPTPIQGGVGMSGGYWAPARVPEMRVIMINHENPPEIEMGEMPIDSSGTGNRDGIDINRDGAVSSGLYSDVTPATSNDVFPVTGAQRLFPRRLARGQEPADGGPPYSPVYLNITEMLVLPVIVQVRWWSQAGVPREITVVTFFTDRGN